MKQGCSFDIGHTRLEHCAGDTLRVQEWNHRQRFRHRQLDHRVVAGGRREDQLVRGLQLEMESLVAVYEHAHSETWESVVKRLASQLRRYLLEVDALMPIEKKTGRPVPLPGKQVNPAAQGYPRIPVMVPD